MLYLFVWIEWHVSCATWEALRSVAVGPPLTLQPCLRNLAHDQFPDHLWLIL